MKYEAIDHEEFPSSMAFDIEQCVSRGTVPWVPGMDKGDHFVEKRIRIEIAKMPYEFVNETLSIGGTLVLDLEFCRYARFVPMSEELRASGYHSTDRSLCYCEGDECTICYPDSEEWDD